MGAGVVKGRDRKSASTKRTVSNARSKGRAKAPMVEAKTSRQQWLNIVGFVARYVALIAFVFASAEVFRRLVGSVAPFEVNLVYFPLFFVAVTGIFGILHFDKLKKYVWVQNWWISGIFVFVGLWNIWTYATFKYGASPVFALSQPVLYLILPGVFFALGAALVAIGVFGVSFVRQFQKELLLVSIVAIPYVSLTFLLRSYWHVFSAIVTKANVALMGFVSSNVSHVIGTGDPSLALESFNVIIGAPCSGVDSLLLFTGLFWFVGLLDFEKYNVAKLVILFPIGLLGTFVMSILRIFALMLIGAYYSSQFALGGFHANAGWIIFVVYFLCFMYFAMPWLKR